jgi:hypothetical protein
LAGINIRLNSADTQVELDGKSAYYIKQGEWQPYLEEALAAAVAPASVEIFEGKYKPLELEPLIDSALVMEKAYRLLSLIYLHNPKACHAL